MIDAVRRSVCEVGHRQCDAPALSAALVDHLPARQAVGAQRRVVLEHMLLKPSMVVAGKEQERQASVADVAAQTIRVLRRSVPAAVPGIFFLSGGQTPAEASAHLDAINRLGPQPWALSFSFGRALQDPVLRVWKGEAVHARGAQDALLKRARLNGAACKGRYASSMESLEGNGVGNESGPAG